MHWAVESGWMVIHVPSGKKIAYIVYLVFVLKGSQEVRGTTGSFSGGECRPWTASYSLVLFM